MTPQAPGSGIEKETPLNQKTTGFKRPPPPSSASTSSGQDKEENLGNSGKETPKRTKIKKGRISSIDFVKHLEPAKNFVLSNIEKYSLNHDKLVAFLQSVRPGENVQEVADMYTNRTDSLANMLTDIYTHITDRNTKCRITRIRNLLNSADPNKVITHSEDSEMSESENLNK